MDQLDEPLSNDELDWLEDFLCTRYGVMEFDHDADVGVFDVAALDGYFTAIVSGPETIPPSLWLKDMDGEFETLWDSEEFFERVFSMMVRHMNSISSWLMADAPSHQPLYMLRQVRDGHYTLLEDWCDGYMRGIRINPHAWDLDVQEIKTALSAILIFGSAQSIPVLEAASEDDLKHLQRQVMPAVAAIHRYWLKRRSDPATVKTFSHDGPRPGRNDPCPCGSGKKYKKCCLN